MRAVLSVCLRILFRGICISKEAGFQNVFEGHSESTAALAASSQSAKRVLSMTRDMTR